MFQESHLMNLRNWWLRCSKKNFRNCSEDPLEKPVFMSCLFWNQAVLAKRQQSYLLSQKDLPKKPLILDLLWKVPSFHNTVPLKSFCFENKISIQEIFSSMLCTYFISQPLS